MYETLLEIFMIVAHIKAIVPYNKDTKLPPAYPSPLTVFLDRALWINMVMWLDTARTSYPNLNNYTLVMKISCSLNYAILMGFL